MHVPITEIGTVTPSKFKTFHVEDGGAYFENFLHLQSYSQQAWNTNSDNLYLSCAPGLVDRHEGLLKKGAPAGALTVSVMFVLNRAHPRLLADSDSMGSST